jgi:23S rRNA (uridine2552-2'-O)-methyltransferase
MRLSTALFKSSSGSSNRWLARQSSDPYVRLRTSQSSPGSAQPETYRSRSAFKLVSLAAKYPGLLGRGKTVIDLGAAPGGWSQVAVRSKAKVIALDIAPMDAIPGVQVVMGDFLSEGVRSRVGQMLSAGRADGEGGADTVLSDMMAPMSGVRGRDVQASLDLCSAATMFGRDVLSVGREEEPAGADSPESAAHRAESGKAEKVLRGKGRKFSGGSMV